MFTALYKKRMKAITVTMSAVLTIVLFIEDVPKNVPKNVDPNVASDVIALAKNEDSGTNTTDNQTTLIQQAHQTKIKPVKTINSKTSELSSTQLSGIELIEKSPVIMESVSEVDVSGNYHATKIVKTDFRFPLIRIVENFKQEAAGSTRLIKRSFMIADHLSVKLQEGVDLNDLQHFAESQGYTIRTSYQDASYALVSFPIDKPDSIEDVKAIFAEQVDLVVYAEIDPLRFLTAVVPNDTQFFRQGHLDYQRSPNAGGPIDNTGAWQAWHRRTDALKIDGEYVSIGIIDSGVAIIHGDLANNIWDNPHEIAGNGIDDDNNGYVDDIHGWDFISDSADYSTLGGHGTHVAGIVAAEGDNNLGVSGMTWRADIISADIFGDGVTTGALSAEAIRYLVGLDVDVMNASYGNNNYSQVECDAVQEAHDAGILLVTSAGNNNVNLDLAGNDQYPAECNIENVMVVGGGSTRAHEIEFGHSNFGAEAVDIIAPFWALSTWYWDAEYPEDSFEELEGTSMSAPMVTGAAALLIAEHPSLSHTEIKALLMNSATRATPIDGTSQSGVLNVARAMNFDVATRAAEVVSITASSHDGNLPEYAMDDDPSTRWSSFGVGESITFELSDDEVLSGIDIQWLKGNERAAKFSVESSVDGASWEQIFGGIYQRENLEQSSGSNSALEYYRLMNVEARYVRITTNGNTENDWNSIIEAVIYVYDE